MITEIESNGGLGVVSGLSGTYTIPPGSARNLSLKFTGSGGVVALPSTTLYNLGGPLFTIQNWGSNSFTLQSSPNVTVGPGNVAKVLLVTLSGVPTWRAFVHSGPRTYGVTAGRSDISSFTKPVVATYSLDCGDVCDANQGSVSVPMWINSCVARNSLRDPIRGADLQIPSKLELRITDSMVRDTGHSYASAMSTQLQQKLFSAPLVLSLDTVGSYGTTSRHPHHIGLDLSGPAWTYPTTPLTVVRKVWRRMDNYSVGGATYTLECRIVAEWVPPTDVGGAWGALISVYVFSNEINPAYVDGTNVSAQNNAPFTHNDPFVYGPLYSGANTHKKFFHPQLLLVAHVPTTFHAPCGYDHVPVGDELWTECYRLTNGAPWSGGVVADSNKNCVFARPAIGGSGFTPARCMTIGGDVPRSEFYPFLVIENGAAYGGTYLKPTNAGWSESLGNLTPLSDVSIRDCGYPQVPVDVCAGNPGEPYGGIGGTHRCFLTSAGAGAACYPPAKPAYLTAVEFCCGYVTTFDDACTATPEICTVYREYRTTFTLQVDDYDFDYLNAGAARYIRWAAVGPDPSYARPEWVPDISFNDMTTYYGTWTHDYTGSEVTTTTGSGFTRASAIWAGTGASYTCGHAKWSGLCKTSTGKNHVIMTRWDPSGETGYAFELKPGSSQLNIYKVASNVATLLASLGSVTLTGDVDVVVSSIGSLHTIQVGAQQVQVDDCTYKYVGQIGVGTSSSSAGARFEQMQPEDWNNRVPNPGSFITGVQLVMTVQIDNNTPAPTMSVVTQPTLNDKFLSGGCTGYVNELCGQTSDGEQTCGCVRTRIAECAQLAFFPTSFNTTETTVVGPVGTGNPSAQDCIDFPPCNSCPPPFAAVRVTLPPTCVPSSWDFQNGAEYWNVTKV